MLKVMLAKELQDIVDFIRAKSEKLKIFNWTDEEIAAYFLEKSKERQVITFFIKVMNLLELSSSIYSPLTTCILNNSGVKKNLFLSLILKILVDNFPKVTHLSFFHQRRKRPYTITVKNFIRIYG
jgi:hypothetical protein